MEIAVVCTSTSAAAETTFDKSTGKPAEHAKRKWPVSKPPVSLLLALMDQEKERTTEGVPVYFRIGGKVEHIRYHAMMS